ncbi:MAG: hypothetical protein AVDCRST_MAG33-1714 [uncultured Thermomicrobiales bacterium]|uniref:Uncharacterized protein n=1 Tax=uncultured Thermomicrobiales bacterium TaxID=1645740 RepID=A0A6J4V0Q3_9BACT|nr:MAG: hypothetical protein AVDCRST_MAG33-1714 [uncultured Thermomicrobiales bacterium]
MEEFIVTGVVIAFLLMLLPAVVIPFVPQNPSVADRSPRPDPDPVQPGSGLPAVVGDATSDRLAA